MVRRLAPTDFERWRSLWIAYQRFYREQLDEAVTKSTFDRLCAGSGPLVGLVADDAKGRLLGIVQLVFHPSTWSTAACCYVEDLFVIREARGTGVARELLEAAFAEADLRGAGRIYWETQEYNSAARSLYDQFGHPTSFVVYER
ncbi:MAG: GNAT family N-acetyltransferase [Candidatus Dormibacteria bacterium]